MTTAFLYIAAVSIITAVVLAVARDVPILHLLAWPDVDVGELIPSVLGLAWLIAVVIGLGPTPMRIAMIPK